MYIRPQKKPKKIVKSPFLIQRTLDRKRKDLMDFRRAYPHSQYEKNMISILELQIRNLEIESRESC